MCNFVITDSSIPFIFSCCTKFNRFSASFFILEKYVKKRFEIGLIPVNKLALDAPHIGTLQYALLKVTPELSKASIFGLII